MSAVAGARQGRRVAPSQSSGLALAPESPPFLNPVDTARITVSTGNEKANKFSTSVNNAYTTARTGSSIGKIPRCRQTNVTVLLNGISRNRVPVTAQIAPASAGAAGGTGGSPIP